MAWRGAERIIAEVKGHTSEPGTDVDTLYGQLLRKMAPDHADTLFALVVPESLRRWVDRVPEEARAKLGIEVWLVPDVGEPICSCRRHTQVRRWTAGVSGERHAAKGLTGVELCEEAPLGHDLPSTERRAAAARSRHRQA